MSYTIKNVRETGSQNFELEVHWDNGEINFPLFDKRIFTSRDSVLAELNVIDARLKGLKTLPNEIYALKDTVIVTEII